mgnify:FL=1
MTPSSSARATRTRPTRTRDPLPLRETVLRAAVDYIAEHGPDGLSLRQVAADAGVSHQAPYHHFGDRRAIFTAIGIEGFTMLDAALHRPAPAGTSSTIAMGEQYVEFALAHTGHFRVMFRRDLCTIEDSPDLRAAADAAFATLVTEARAVVGPDAPEAAVHVRALTMWSLTHGLATLLIDGPVEEKIGPVRNRRALVRAVLADSGIADPA